jgi:hypothetical protein
VVALSSGFSFVDVNGVGSLMRVMCRVLFGGCFVGVGEGLWLRWLIRVC